MSKMKRIAKYIRQEKQVLEDRCIDLLNNIEDLQNNIAKIESDLFTYTHFNMEQDVDTIDNLCKDRVIYEKELLLKKLELELEIAKLANKNANLNWIDDRDDLEN